MTQQLLDMLIEVFNEMQNRLHFSFIISCYYLLIIIIIFHLNISLNEVNLK